MAPRWLPNRHVLASWSFFRDLLPNLRFPMLFCFSGALKASIFYTFWNKIRQFLARFWHLGSCMPQKVSRYPHKCCRMAYLSLSGPNMDPSWLKLGPCWTQVGSNLAQVGPMLGPFAGAQPPLGQPKPFQTSSLLPLDLPNPHLHPIRPETDPNRASQTSNLDSKPQLGS